MTRSGKKILIIGTFPIVRAHHGGSKRVKAIVKAYSGHFAEVKYAAVFSRFAFPIHATSDIPVSFETDRQIRKNREFEDIIVGRSVYDDQKVKRRVRELLENYRPDIIQIEQVYPYLGLRKILAEMDGYRPQIVLSAHNIESQMKADIYRRLGRGQEALEELRAAELELIERAEFIVAVGAQDKADLEKLGAKRIVVAPNGIAPIEAKGGDIAYWRNVFATEGIQKTYLFVSSAHLPNWHGFLSALGNKLGFLDPTERIVMAGSLSDYVVELYKKPRTIEEVTFWKRSLAAGRLTEGRLAGLIAASDVILLPITGGGGSNLKTAEAILSGKKIVATSYAFRAYEQFMSYPNVWIADDPAAFRVALREAAVAPVIERTPGQRQATTAVLWDNTLGDLVNEVTKL